MTDLPAIDRAAVDAFWRRAVASGIASVGSPVPDEVERFGDTEELANELIDLVLHGPKRATATSVSELEHAGEPVPAVGGLWIACDGVGAPRAVLRTTEVRVGPLSSVDDAFAWDEGEGDRTRADWLDGHERYFRSLPRIGVEFTDDMPTVFERFEVAYSE